MIPILKYQRQKQQMCDMVHMCFFIDVLNNKIQHQVLSWPYFEAMRDTTNISRALQHLWWNLQIPVICCLRS